MGGELTRDPYMIRGGMRIGEAPALTRRNIGDQKLIIRAQKEGKP